MVSAAMATPSSHSAVSSTVAAWQVGVARFDVPPATEDDPLAFERTIWRTI